ncbi:MAG: hypothetical protein DME33_13040 [Verrucomicrobia bacterium]|nr:MAG: hypothetical protein DME33_13040 [Verrucomicrobiota bacterium]
MRSLLFVGLCISVLLTLSGCRQRRHAPVPRDACSLLSKKDVESVQKSPVNEMKSSEHVDGTFRISQCLYTAAEFSKSISLALIQLDPHQHGARNPRDFWKERFGPYATDTERREKAETETAENDKGPAPKKIAGLGDDAYWVSNRFGGILYVLKGDAFISVGIGGTDDEATKLEKSKSLAQKALKRL